MIISVVANTPLFFCDTNGCTVGLRFVVVLFTSRVRGHLYFFCKYFQSNSPSCAPLSTKEDFQELGSVMSYFKNLIKNCLDSRKKGNNQMDKANKRNSNSSPNQQPFQESLCQLMCVTPWFSVLSLFVAPTDFLYFLVSIGTHFKGCLWCLVFCSSIFRYL